MDAVQQRGEHGIDGRYDDIWRWTLMFVPVRVQFKMDPAMSFFV